MSGNELNLNSFKKIIKEINIVLEKNKEYLSEMDSFTGDGDHGFTISKAFDSANNVILEKKPNTISELLKLIGNTLIINVGGSAGPIFGTFFKTMGDSIDESLSSINIEDLKMMMSNGMNKVMDLGGAKPGDKTMIDTIVFAIKSLEKSCINNEPFEEAILKMINASKKGAYSTAEMIAKKGRAKTSGERSLGHIDPGAFSMFLIFSTFKEVL